LTTWRHGFGNAKRIYGRTEEFPYGQCVVGITNPESLTGGGVGLGPFLEFIFGLDEVVNGEGACADRIRMGSRAPTFVDGDSTSFSGKWRLEVERRV
jgi:hypothetical protein